jgi:hypothetical protein
MIMMMMMMKMAVCFVELFQRPNKIMHLKTFGTGATKSS